MFRATTAGCCIALALLIASAQGNEFFAEVSFQPFADAPIREVGEQGDNSPVPVSEPVVYEVGSNLDFKAKWSNGLRFSTVDRAFQLHVGGRFHADAVFWLPDGAIEQGPNGVNQLQDGVSYRRARIRVNGKFYEVVSWIMEYGFEAGTPVFFDVFGEIQPLPFGSVRVGHFREPFSMDALTSGNELPFMERSLFHDAFVPFRNAGIAVHNVIRDETMTYAVGAFRSSSNRVAADAGDENYAGTGRVTFSPWHNVDDRFAFHLGASYSIRSPARRTALGIADPTGLKRVRYATRPEIRVSSPLFVDTGFIEVEQSQLLGLEVGISAGPLLLQAESVMTFLSDAAAPGSSDVFFHGWYAQASWLLTGEHRAYDSRQGFFKGIKPFENYFWAPGCEGCPATWGRGAWELGARVSHIDVTDAGIDGGRLYNLTVGLNWYLNPNCRWMFNYIHAWRNVADNEGTASVIGSRFQVDF